MKKNNKWGKRCPETTKDGWSCVWKAGHEGHCLTRIPYSWVPKKRSVGITDKED